MNARTEERSDAVAAYASLDGAERAVAHLVGAGYAEEDIKIGPRDYEEVDPQALRRILGRWMGRGLAGGAALMAVVGIGWEIGAATLVDSVLPLIVWGAVIGVVTGLVIASIAYRVQNARRFLTPATVLEPTRFEVVAERDRDRARNDLARWWDPAALPAGWHPPT